MACFSGGKYVAFNAENQDMLYLHVLGTTSSIYRAKLDTWWNLYYTNATAFGSCFYLLN